MVAGTARDLSEEDIGELQRLLYGLYAVLELHFSQEDESCLSLVDADTSTQAIP